MTWFRCGGGSGIPAALKNRMNEVFNKKFGTAIDYPVEGWPDDVNLMGPLPEGTATGPIVTFADGADDVPTKAVKISIPPTLTGVSEVSEKQTGRNLASELLEWNATNRIISPIFLKSGTYTVSFQRSVSPSAIYIRKGDTIRLGGDAYATKYNSTFFTFTADESTYYYVQIYRSASSTTWEEAPVTNAQIELGSTAHAYEPYQTPTQYTASLGRTVYGGEVDIVNGEGQDEYGYIVFDGSNDENWGGYSAYNGYYIGISDMKSGTRQDGVCNQLTCSQSTAQGQIDAFWLGVGNSRLYVIGVYDSMGSTIEAFRAYLAENPLILVYPIATPTDITFDGQEIPTRLGYNAFWSDSGDTEITYRADISLALQAASGSRGLMMASRPAIEPANGDQGSEESTENNIETEGEEDAR